MKVHCLKTVLLQPDLRQPLAKRFLTRQSLEPFKNGEILCPQMLTKKALNLQRHPKLMFQHQQIPETNGRVSLQKMCQKVSAITGINMSPRSPGSIAKKLGFINSLQTQDCSTNACISSCTTTPCSLKFREAITLDPNFHRNIIFSDDCQIDITG